MMSGICAMILAGAASACSAQRAIMPADPLTAEEHVRLGSIYEAQHLNDLADQEFQTALGQRPRSTTALVGLGNLAFKRGAFGDAQDYYNRALAIEPDHPGANNNLAMVYLTLGNRVAEAERLALTALDRAGPLRPYVLDTLAGIYRRQGRERDAQDALKEAEALMPGDSTVLRNQINSREPNSTPRSQGGADAVQPR
jgi:Tfp pilus assembly protein PilF